MIPGAFKQNVMDALGLVRKAGWGGIYGRPQQWRSLGQKYMNPKLTMSDRFNVGSQFAKRFFGASDFSGQGLTRSMVIGARAAPVIGTGALGFSLFD